MYEHNIPEGLELLPFPERLKQLAELASLADPYRRIFGSKETDYKFAPPVSIERMRDVEDKYRIPLPQELFEFFTQVGNGGAGVDYGIFPLERIEKQYFSDRGGGFVYEPYQPTVFDREDPDFFYLESACRIRQFEEKDGPEAKAESDRLHRDIIRNLLVIGTAGCTYDYFIVLTGRKKGMIGRVNWDLNASLGQGPILYGLSLSEWLEDHFRRIILGEIVSRSTFDSVRYTTDIGGKKRAVPREYTKEEKKQALAAVNAEPAPPPPPPPPPPRYSAPPPPPPRYSAPPPPAPAPQPAPPPPIPPRRGIAVGDFIEHKRYGKGMVTNIVGNIVSAEFMSCGLKSLIMPYDEKDIIKK